MSVARNRAWPLLGLGCFSLVAAFPIAVALWWLTAAVGSSLLPSRSFHLRGQFDRANRHIRDCTSGQTYDLALRSGSAFRLGALQDALRPAEGEALIIEFDAHTLPPKLPWDPYEAVGIHGDLSLVRGTCGDTTNRPNQTMQRTPTRRSPETSDD
jgi:hypothetical protein